MIRWAWRRIRLHPKVLAGIELLSSPDYYEGYRLTWKRRLNLYLARYERARCRTRLWSRPVKLTLEATNVCNLRCPACFTGAGELGRPRSMMSLELYRKLLDEIGDYLLECEFYNWGEPLLNKNIWTMVREASARGIGTRISTNFSIPFDERHAEELVTSGLSVLGVSIDGARQETYEQYRVRGDLAKVLANCRLVTDAKKKLGSRTPRLIWEFHVFAHNVDDIETAKQMASDLDMEIAVEKGWVVGPDWDKEGKYRFFMDPVPNRCGFLWVQAVVNNDGGLSPCCGTFYREDDMGRIALRPDEFGARSFREIWNGTRFQEARKLFRSREGASDEARQSICFDCPATIIWESWQKHLAAGGAPEGFKPGYSTNDCFNYFWHRRPVRSGAPRRTVELPSEHVASQEAAPEREVPLRALPATPK
jgi:MoaA/NifB/PqqE/SkfB family radical SAM enzyme